MGQLRFKDIWKIYNHFKVQGMENDEILNLPIYIGNDEELNGVHTAFFVNPIENNEEGGYYKELINADPTNIPLNSNAILIS